MRAYLRNRLPERSTRYGLILIAAVLAPPEWLDQGIEQLQKFGVLLGAAGGIAALIPERKPET